jgi:deferrochelatase/peroxidase EfeB
VGPDRREHDRSPGAEPTEEPGLLSRRRLLGVGLGAAGGLGAGVALPGVGSVLDAGTNGETRLSGASGDAVEPFYGLHQGGVTTPPQRHTQFASFDVITDDRSELAALLRRWTLMGAKLAAGRLVGPVGATDIADADSGEAVGLGPARLTVNVGLGPGLFGIGRPDRFGFRAQWPSPLVELPAFPGDRLTTSTKGGDLSVQVCADDPQVAFHALRQMARTAGGTATLRWSQGGFNDQSLTGGVPRDLLGFKDGTVNLRTEREMDTFVWVGSEGPDWMVGGTYVVVRRISIAIERWDAQPLAIQERVVGRHKTSGAPLGATRPSAPLDLDARDSRGQPVIPLDAHVRLASPQTNWGQRMFRRSYSYDNGLRSTPGGPMLDAGLLFVVYQRNPRVAFIPIFHHLARHDALNAFTTHTASVIAALPRAPRGPGDWIARQLFEA